MIVESDCAAPPRGAAGTHAADQRLCVHSRSRHEARAALGRRLRIVNHASPAPQSEWPADGWWRRYGDMQLAQLMQEALASSPDLQVAAARLRAAEGFAQRAGAALKPQVDAFARPTLSKLSQNGTTPAAAVPNGWNDSGAAGFGFSLDLDLWGKNRAAFRAANARRRRGPLRARRGAAGHHAPELRRPMLTWLRFMRAATASNPRSRSARRRRSSSRIASRSVSIRSLSRSRPKRGCRRPGPTSRRRTKRSRSRRTRSQSSSAPGPIVR